MRDDRRDNEEMERKLRAYFRAETGDLGSRNTLWEYMSRRLGAQQDVQEPRRRPGFLTFAAGRLATYGLTLLGMLTLTFFLLQMAPGDVSEAMLAGEGGGAARPESLTAPRDRGAANSTITAQFALSGAQSSTERRRAPAGNGAAYDATFFRNYGVNPFVDPLRDHLSTFAMDVDTASYTVARRFVMDGRLPDRDAVRVEEFVNYFRQDYAPPEEGAFAIHLDGAPAPLAEDRWLVRVGLQGREIPADDRQDATLIFVIDVSGSMRTRLDLVKSSLRLLVEELRPTDNVGIVVYGSAGSVLLEPSAGTDKGAILEAINGLQSSGSTNAEEGLRLGYAMAVEALAPGRITRILLCSDGVANVGRTGPGEILKEVRGAAAKGVTLSTIGFGMGNYNDILMERLANDGDGNYAYVDTLAEAERVFTQNLTGMLQVIARDAKVQVDFNPEVVKEYRLLGYENRDVADQDFRNDAVDAGEVGAGHSVTALYEVRLHPEAAGRIATASIRYADPETGTVREQSREITTGTLAPAFADASPRFQLSAAVALYAEVLRKSYWTQGTTLEDVRALAERVSVLLPGDADVRELQDVVTRAARLAG